MIAFNSVVRHGHFKVVIDLTIDGIKHCEVK